ncbi:MAG: GAF domain-containing protein [Anaerolineae bacterium]|nr:GAF domain-containing protein [Anaerolineae bacterium]
MAKTSDTKKTKAELVEELQKLHRQVARLQKQVDRYKGAEAAPTQEQTSSALQGALILEEHKRAEEALRESEGRYRTILESVQEGYFEVDIAGNFTFFTDVLCEILGYPRDELMGMNNREYMDAENAKTVYRAFNEAYRTRRSAPAISYEVIRKDGARRSVEVGASVITDSTGEPVGFHGVMRDITERERAEAERERLLVNLEHRALQLQTAAEVSRVVSGTLDPDELIHQVVGLVRERFDLYYAGLFLVDQTGEWSGQPGRWAVLRAGTGEAGQKMLEQGHKLVVGGESMIGSCIADGRARIALDVGKEGARFENPLLPKTRSELALPLIARDEAIGALTIQSTQEAAFTQEDIVVLQTMADQLANAIVNARLYEALAQEQYLLNALLDSTPDHIYFKDTESRFIRVSRSQSERFGLDDSADIVGMIDFDFFTEEHARPAYEDEQRIVRTGEPVLGLEEKETWPDGSVSWVSTSKMPLRDEAGRIIGTFGISSDVTARKQAELALERRAVQLQTVAEVGREAAAILDVRQLLNRTVNLVSEGFGFYHAGIFLLDDLKQYAVLRAASSEGGQRMLERGHSLPVGQVGIVGSAAAANEPYVALDVGEDAVFFDNPDLPETRSEMALPLSIRGEAIGVLDVQSEEPSAFTEEDVATLRILADQLAVAIQNARLVERTEEQLRELNLLYGQFSAETWERLLSAERPLGYIYDRIDVSPVDGSPSPAYDLAVERGEVVELDASEASEAVLAVPLRVRGQVIGSLGVEAGDGRDWTPEEITLVEAVSEQVAQAIDGARLFAEAQKTALSMESLYQTSRAISSSLEEEAMIRAVLEAVYRTLNCEHVLLCTVDEERRTIGLQHGIWGGEFDIYPEWKETNQYSLDDHDIIPNIYRSGRTEIIGEWDDRFNREIWDKFGHERFLRVFMPINLRERVIGVVEVAYDKHRKNRISDDEVQMLSAFMDQAAVALENIRLFDQAQRRAQREHRIYEIANRLRRSPDISTILQTAVDELGRTLEVDRAMVRLRVKPREERARAAEAARAEEQEQPVEG